MAEAGRPTNGKDPETGRFVTGNIGGGRPKGARAKLGEKFMEDMLTAWQAEGIDAINRVIRDRPQDFLKVVASLLPKEIAGEITHRFVARLPMPAETTEQWQKQHTPTTLNPLQ